jgi:hypothetical protein
MHCPLQATTHQAIIILFAQSHIHAHHRKPDSTKQQHNCLISLSVLSFTSRMYQALRARCALRTSASHTLDHFHLATKSTYDAQALTHFTMHSALTHITIHKLSLTLRCTQLSLTLRYTSSHSLYDAFSSHSHYDTQALTHTAMHSALTHFAMHKLSSHAHNDAPLNISEERAQHSSLAYQHKPQHMQAGRALLNRA